MNEVCNYLMSMSEDECDEDTVVIEGSELHQALTNIGYTDFECTPVHRQEFNDYCEELKPINLPQLPENTNKFNSSNNKNFYGSQYIKIILQLDPVLDDHASAIQTMLAEVSSSNKRHTFHWPSLKILTSLGATSFLIYKPTRIFGLAMITSLTSFMGYRKYSEFYSTRSLKELVSIQNDVYYLYKRSLKILKDGFCIKVSLKKPQRRFSDLESGKLKYLQPMCETLVQSIETISREFYRISQLLLDLLPNTYDIDNLITRFNSGFILEGELTYEKLKRMYYVYILVQSEMMQLLAILYKENSISRGEFNQLTRIINTLVQLLKDDKIKLGKIIEEYNCCKIVPIRHELRKHVGAKWQDLYLHVDLLSRKIQSAYSLIGCIFEDIDSCSDLGDNDELIDSLMQKMNTVYKEIDTARNFAEFNNLLIGKFRNIKIVNNELIQEATMINNVQQLNIVHDTDPLIIDEVFEEYIKEEYLKPLYKENDFDFIERAKLDKILEKNFRSELKEFLIDKYREMSEREALALMRYRKNINTDFEQEINIVNCEHNFIIPPAPPLPANNKSSSMDETSRNRPPMPLPRSINLTQYPKMESTLYPTARRRQRYEENVTDDEIDCHEQFSINMSVERIRLPAFTTTEETFIGSGENSEIEVINSDYESDSN